MTDQLPRAITPFWRHFPSIPPLGRNTCPYGGESGGTNTVKGAGLENGKSPHDVDQTQGRRLPIILGAPTVALFRVSGVPPSFSSTVAIPRSQWHAASETSIVVAANHHSTEIGLYDAL